MHLPPCHCSHSSAYSSSYKLIGIPSAYTYRRVHSSKVAAAEMKRQLKSCLPYHQTHRSHSVPYCCLRSNHVTIISIYYVHKVDAQGGTRHLPPPRRRTRELLSGRGGCARGQTSCGLDAKRQTVSRVSDQPAVSR